jgi:hypothetical protein
VFREAQYWGDERRRLRLRLLVALAFSVLLHGLPSALGLLAGLALRALPKPPIQVEILPPRKRAPPPVVVEPPAPSPSQADSKSADLKPPAPKKPEPKPERRDKGPQLPTTRLTGLGPTAVDEELGLRVLLRMPALRTTPHRQVVETLLAAFPDTHILAAGTRFPSPTSLSLSRAFIDDIDALLIATADPRDITATTFYAKLRAGTDLLSRLEGRRQLSWDSRRVRQLRPDLFSFARPDLLGPGTPPPPPPAPGAPTSPPASPVSAGPDERALAAWSDRLAQALSQPGPAVYAEVNNPQGRIRLRGDVPTPTAVRVVLSADADPQLVAHIELATQGDAERLLTILPQLRSELSGKLFWLGLGGLLSDLRFAQPAPLPGARPPRRPTVEVRGKLPRADVAVLLLWMKGWLPPPDRFPELVPPAPPPATPPATGDLPDAGVADSR